MPFFHAYSTRRVYWASQQTVSLYDPAVTNTAGAQDLATQGTLICGAATRAGTLIWSTHDLWLATYIGGDFVYSFAKIGDNCGIISARGWALTDVAAYWMGNNNFYAYDGFVRPIACEVHDYVFNNFNKAQVAKVWCLANPLFQEITWFYPSAVATECDSYVTYNHNENHWSFGTLQRSAGVTQEPGGAAPVMVDSVGNIYDHETGVSYSGATTPFAESGPIELGEGDQTIRLQRIVPDDNTAGSMSAYIYTALFPTTAETLNGPYVLSNAPVSLRLTARQVRLKVTNFSAQTSRLGTVRLGGMPGGRR